MSWINFYNSIITSNSSFTKNLSLLQLIYFTSLLAPGNDPDICVGWLCSFIITCCSIEVCFWISSAKRYDSFGQPKTLLNLSLSSFLHIELCDWMLWNNYFYNSFKFFFTFWFSSCGSLKSIFFLGYFLFFSTIKWQSDCYFWQLGDKGGIPI